MTATPIKAELNKHELFRERLRKEFPDLDEDALADTLEGMTDLTEMIAATLRSAREDLALVNGLTDYMNTLEARQERIEGRMIRKREICLEAMERANITKIAQPDFTASLRSNPAKVVVTDEAKIPATFFEPQPDKLSKRQLLIALQEGTTIEGATLSNPQRTITIRSK